MHTFVVVVSMCAKANIHQTETEEHYRSQNVWVFFTDTCLQVSVNVHLSHFQTFSEYTMNCCCRVPKKICYNCWSDTFVPDVGECEEL